MFTEKRLADLSCQYGLDGGGYGFENPPEHMPELSAIGVVVWDEPDFDYLTGDNPLPREYRYERPLFVFAPGPWSETFPATLATDDPDTIYVLMATGDFQSHDRDCDHCGPGTDEDHSYSDDACDCTRCNGHHYVSVEGGPWACYAQCETPRTGEPREDWSRDHGMWWEEYENQPDSYRDADGSPEKY